MINQIENNDFLQSQQQILTNQNQVSPSGYLTKEIKMIIQTERPTNIHLISKKKIVVKKRKQQALVKDQHVASQVAQNTSKQLENVQTHSYSQNFQEKNYFNNQSLYEIVPYKQSKLIQYQQRGLSLSKTRHNQSNDYILTPKSNRSYSTSISLNSSSNLFQSQISETKSSAYLNGQKEKQYLQSDATCKTIFQVRRELNNQYSQLISNKPINQDTLQFCFQSEDQKNENLEFNQKIECLKSSQNILDQNESMNIQKSENNIFSSKLNETPFKKNNSDIQSLHKYFQFLLNKPSKEDLHKVKEHSDINFKKGKKIILNNEKIKSEPLSQRQKQKIEEAQLNLLKNSQKNEIKCLEKLKHQYRQIQSNQLNNQQESAVNQDYFVSNQNQKYSRKISYQDYQNDFIEPLSPLKLKKGHSEQEESINLKCESPLTAKLEQALGQNVKQKPQTFSSIRQLNKNILLNNSPIKNIKEKRLQLQLNLSQDKTKYFADIVIKKNEIRERKKEEVGELANYDFSAIHRSPCKLKKYEPVKIDIKQKRFENIMNNQSIQKQFKDIQNLINSSSTGINKIKIS